MIKKSSKIFLKHSALYSLFLVFLLACSDNSSQVDKAARKPTSASAEAIDTQTASRTQPSDSDQNAAVVAQQAAASASEAAMPTDPAPPEAPGAESTTTPLSSQSIADVVSVSFSDAEKLAYQTEGLGKLSYTGNYQRIGNKLFVMSTQGKNKSILCDHPIYEVSSRHMEISVLDLDSGAGQPLIAPYDQQTKSYGNALDYCDPIETEQSASSSLYAYPFKWQHIGDKDYLLLTESAGASLSSMYAAQPHQAALWVLEGSQALKSQTNAFRTYAKIVAGGDTVYYLRPRSLEYGSADAFPESRQNAFTSEAFVSELQYLAHNDESLWFRDIENYRSNTTELQIKRLDAASGEISSEPKLQPPTSAELSTKHPGNHIASAINFIAIDDEYWFGLLRYQARGQALLNQLIAVSREGSRSVVIDNNIGAYVNNASRLYYTTGNELKYVDVATEPDANSNESNLTPKSALTFTALKDKQGMKETLIFSGGSVFLFSPKKIEEDGILYSLYTHRDGEGRKESSDTETTIFSPDTIVNANDGFSAVEYQVHRQLGDSVWPIPGGIVFVAEANNQGAELWFSDGGRQNTYQIADIAPGPADSNPEELYVFEDTLYFTASDGTSAPSPWVIQSISEQAN